MAWVKIAIHTSFSTPSVPGWTAVPRTASGIVTLGDAPIRLNIAKNMNSQLNHASYAGGDLHDGTDFGPIPVSIIKASGAYSDSATTSEFIIEEASPGAMQGKKVARVLCWGASSVTGNDRKTRWTIGGTQLEHNAQTYGAAAPVEFPITSETLPLTINSDEGSGSIYHYAAAILVEIVETNTVSASIISSTAVTATVPVSGTDGTVYAVAVGPAGSATVPSGAQIEAGNDGANAAAIGGSM